MNGNNVRIFNSMDDDIIFQYQYSECYKCFSNNVTVDRETNSSVFLMPNFAVNLQVMTKSLDKICCQKTYTMVGDTTYNYTVSKISNNISCFLDPMKLDDYLPLYLLLISLSLCAVLYYVFVLLYRNRVFQRMGSRLFMYQIDSLEDLGNPRNSYALMIDEDGDGLLTKALKASSRKRIRAVDAFRGISVVLMVFVNYGGGKYRFMAHSPWNGLTVADIVFPWFTFVMGATVAIRLFKMSKMMKLRWFKLWLETVRRSATLFIIGVSLGNPNSQLATLRIMGPLQRLAVAYFVVVTSICVVSVISQMCQCGSRPESELETDLARSSNEINTMKYQHLWTKCQQIAPDIVKSLPFIAICCGLLVAHGCISLLVAVDNCPRGYLGPGGIGDFGCCGNCTGGVAGFIDRYILSPAHMYANGTSKRLYHPQQPFDPEGILGNLTCTALCFLGYWAGNVLLLNRAWLSIIKRLFIYAVVCAAIGAGLCECKLNGGLIPINKNLWSVSYVLVTAGTSFFLLAVLFTMIDAFDTWSGAPFIYPGTNPIVVYVGHEILQSTFPVQWDIHMKYNHTYNLLMNFWGTVFWTLIGFVMYLKNLTISV